LEQYYFYYFCFFKSLENTLQGSETTKASRARRWSYQNGHNPFKDEKKSYDISSNRAAALQYGNMAQEYDIIKSELQTLQKEMIMELKHVVKCEIANILFVNDRTRNLSLYVDEK